MAHGLFACKLFAKSSEFHYTDIMKRIHLRPRLAAAAAMLRGPSLADIGCDHGKLCAFLLQNDQVLRAIGVDISAPSLEKARSLRALCALEDRWQLREGSGLSCLEQGEAALLAFCGMGGELIAQLLEQGAPIAKEAVLIVMQPMGGTAELRAYLCSHGYRIVDEVLALDAGRIYQIIAAKAGAPSPWPRGFPPGCFNFGPLLFEKHDPLLLPLLLAYRDSHQKRLEKARRKGRDPAALLSLLEEAETLIQLAKGEDTQ